MSKVSEAVMWDNIYAFKNSIKLKDRIFFTLPPKNPIYESINRCGFDVIVPWSILEKIARDRLRFLVMRVSSVKKTWKIKCIYEVASYLHHEKLWRDELRFTEEEITMVESWIADEYHDATFSEVFEVFSFMSWVKKIYAESYGYDDECWGFSGPFQHSYGYYLDHAISAYYQHLADIDPIIQERIKREKEAEELEERKNAYWDRVGGMVGNSPLGTASLYVKNNPEPT